MQEMGFKSHFFPVLLWPSPLCFFTDAAGWFCRSDLSLISWLSKQEVKQDVVFAVQTLKPPEAN